MINSLKVLALIPARGGSKGIKNKNIVNLCGKPLIAYSIESAKNSRYIDSVVVSTDSKEIAEVSLKYGAEVPFLRPDELASDTSKTIDAVLHAINELEKLKKDYDILVLLQPTQPLRTTQDIDNALELFNKKGRKALVSVSEVEDHPILIRSINDDGVLDHLLNIGSTCRRQDMPKYYRVNGCIYINSISEISERTSFNDNMMPFVMKKSHSVDIDEMKDIYLAEYYLQQEGQVI